jgi:hypothetical protein
MHRACTHIVYVSNTYKILVGNPEENRPLERMMF